MCFEDLAESQHAELCSCSGLLYFEVKTLCQLGVGYLFKGIFFKSLKNDFILTGAVCTWSRIVGRVFPCWLFALHLLAHLLVSQQSPVELGGSDYPGRSADPPAAGGVRHLQSGTLTDLHRWLTLLILSRSTSSLC